MTRLPLIPAEAESKGRAPTSRCAFTGSPLSRGRAVRVAVQSRRNLHSARRCGGLAGGADDQNAVRIDVEVLARKHDRGRAELFDHSRPVEREAGAERSALEHRRLAEFAVEVD